MPVCIHAEMDWPTWNREKQLIMSKFCNQLIITNKYMKNLASILSTVLLAVTAILTVTNVFLLDTTESLQNKLLKESQLQWLEDDIRKSRNSYVSINSSLLCTHLIVAHFSCVISVIAKLKGSSSLTGSRHWDWTGAC